MKQENCCAVIVAAGSGRRMGTAQKKQYLLLQGKTILEHTLQMFESAQVIHSIVLVVGKEEVSEIEASFASFTKLQAVVSGGEERWQSVKSGLSAVPENTDVVLIHDGVRPFVEEDLLTAAVRKARECGACIPALPVKDTIKQAGEDGSIVLTPSRQMLWQAQTPQAFSLPLIRQAYDIYEKNPSVPVTDDASLLEAQGKKVWLIPGSEENIKITTPWDLKIAELILKERGEK